MEETGLSEPPPFDPFAHIRVRWLLVWIPLVTGALLALFAGAFPKSLKQPYQWVTFALAFSLSQAVWIGWQQRRHRLSMSALLAPSPAGDDWRLLRLVLPIILISLGATWLVYVPLSYLFPRFVTNFIIADSPALFLSGKTTYNIVVALIVILVAPAVEEVLFRGFLLHRFTHKWGTQRAVLGTSFLFGILHADVLGHFVFGVVMCLLYVRSGTLRLPIAVHMLNNAIAMTLAAAQLPRDRNPYSLAEFRSHWWVGVLCLSAGLYILIRLTRGYWDLRSWRLPPMAPLAESDPGPREGASNI
jgi:membrane protease YdiL (CAAX protease family)